MRLRAIAVRVPFLLALAAVLALLLSMSSLLRLVPAPPTRIALLAAPTFLILLVPAVLTQRSPLPAALVITVPVLAAAAYDDSRLDWLRTLKDFDVANASAGPNWARLSLSIGTLLLVWGMHAVDNALRLRWSAIERGIVVPQASAAARVALGAGARIAAVALGGTLIVGALTWGASFLDADALFGGRSSLIAPLVAVGLIAAAAVLLTRDRSSVLSGLE
ncbi:MAG: hypothetical protein WDA16_11400 [Candidatus Thermoplasmatota archaeon]